MAIPSLKWYRRLMEAGFTDEQARAIVDVARDVYVARLNEARAMAGRGPVRVYPKEVYTGKKDD